MLLAACLSLSCAEASLVNVWKDPTQPADPMRHVFVVAMSGNAAMRRLWEDGFVFELEKHGVAAAPSYREFPDAVPDTAQVVGAVRAGDYDGVIVTHRLPTQTERHYVPGFRSYEPLTVYSPWGHYATYYEDVYHRGYVETDRIVRYQTDLLSTASQDRMVWTAVGEVLDPTSGEAIQREIAKTVIPKLARERLIPSEHHLAGRSGSNARHG
jgi:hypothetical protein